MTTLMKYLEWLSCGRAARKGSLTEICIFSMLDYHRQTEKRQWALIQAFKRIDFK